MVQHWNVIATFACSLHHNCSKLHPTIKSVAAVLLLSREMSKCEEPAYCMYAALLLSVVILQLHSAEGYPMTYVCVRALSASDLVKKAEGFVQVRLAVEQLGK